MPNPADHDLFYTRRVATNQLALFANSGNETQFQQLQDTLTVLEGATHQIQENAAAMFPGGWPAIGDY
jgi:hypothetical protein